MTPVVPSSAAAGPAAAAGSPAPAFRDASLAGYCAKGHANNFNLLRFLAAFAVLVSHSFPIVLGEAANAEPFSSRIGYTLGGVAVDVFFVISGFLVTASLLRLDAFAPFARARALRILPGLLPMALLLAFALGPYFTSLSAGDYFGQGLAYKFVLKNATALFGWEARLPGVFEHLPLRRTVNGSLWTLPLEIRCYLCIALLWFVARSTGRDASRRFALVLAALAAALLVAFWITRTESGNWHVYRLSYLFACGALFHVLRDRIRLRHALAATLALVLCLVCAFLPGAFFCVYPLVLAYLVFYAAYVPGGWIRRFNRIGDYSYGIYIYAFPVQQSLLALYPGIGVPRMIAAAGAITLLLAIASWHLVEHPALRFKPRRSLEFDRSGPEG